MKYPSLAKVTLALALLSVVGCAARINAPERFASPEAAVAKLAQVVASNDLSQAAALLGSQGKFLLDSGDQTLDRQRTDRFSLMFKERHSLHPRNPGEYVVLLGNKQWPFAAPLVQRGDSWIFDAEAGKDEVLSRRIGENEFSTLETVRSIYLAQRLYAATDWNGDGVYQYAERIISTPGSNDGLYWPTFDEDLQNSPLSSAFARATHEGYSITSGGEPQPFHGYFYKLLFYPAQPGAPVDTLSKPGRYWLFSTPSVWNESGVMTFAANERGWIFEKNLGSSIDYRDLSQLTVDDTWTRVE